jgi:hypothetical protein
MSKKNANISIFYFFALYKILLMESIRAIAIIMQIPIKKILVIV